MKKKIKISIAANTMVPCVVVLEELGYTITNYIESDQEMWCAKRDGDQFISFDPCQLLGLIKLVEVRGAEWRASDEQIKDYFARFYPDET